MPRMIMKSGFFKSLTHTVNYLEYMQEQGDLFSYDGDATLNDAIEQAVRHGNSRAWRQIMSLQYADCERLAIDRSYMQTLLAAKRDEIAKAYNINPANLQVYASWHNKDFHPHLHMVFFSRSAREGFLRGTKDDKHAGLKAATKRLKSACANTIFEGDLHDIKVGKAQARNQLNEQMLRELQAAVQKEFVDPVLRDHFRDLSRELRQHFKTHPTGRRAYMYLPPHLKRQIDAVLREVVQSSDFTRQLYERYAGYQYDLLETYAKRDDTLAKKMSEWEQAFFSPGKGGDTKRHNMILRTALGMDATTPAQSNSKSQTVYRAKNPTEAARALMHSVADTLRQDISRQMQRKDDEQYKKKSQKKERDRKFDHISHDESMER